MANSKNSSIIKVLTALTFLIMIAVNALANILPIGGIGTGAVSDSYPNLFAPAALTFSIWGVIYILLALYTLYQIGLFNKSEDEAKQNMVVKVSTLFMISSLVNSAWIFSWHYKVIWASLLLMAALFVLLAMIVVEIKRHKLTTCEKLFVRVPFSVYFGWITVASIANMTTFLVDVGWNGFGMSEPFWAAAVISVGALIGIITTIVNKDFFYGLVLIWAYVGILIKHMSKSGFDGMYTAVIVTVSICLALLAAADVIALMNKKENKKA